MAEKDKKDIDQIFKHKLLEHSRNPRPQAWQKLSAALQEEKKPVRKIPMLWISSIAAALILGLGIGTYWWQSGSSSENANQFVITEDNVKENDINLENNTTLEEKNIEKDNQENQNLQEEELTPEQQEENQKRTNDVNNSTPNRKERKANDKIKKEKGVLNELDKNAPIRLKDKEQPVLVENTPKRENPKNETGEKVRVVVKVKLSGRSNASQQNQLAQNNKKPKRKINKVLKALKDFKEGELPERDSLGFESERLWASIGKK